MIVPTHTNYYVKVFDNVLEKKFCQKIITRINKNDVNWLTHNWNVGYDKETGENLPNQSIHDQELSIVTIETKEARLLTDNLWEVIRRYYDEVLEGFTWYTGWEGYSHVRFNKYDVNTKMSKHCDHIKTLFTGNRRGIPVLTVLGALNDNYEGGNLIIGNDEVILKTGSVVIFPSNFMYPHEVQLVTKGTRYSFVSWVY
jgi:hypothetical protein